MDGISKDSIKTAKLMKQLWPQLTDKEAIDEVKKYTNGKNTAIFTEVEGDTIVGLALCSLRFDYVEGCKYSPVGFLEGIIVDEEYRLKEQKSNQDFQITQKIPFILNVLMLAFHALLIYTDLVPILSI